MLRGLSEQKKNRLLMYESFTRYEHPFTCLQADIEYYRDDYFLTLLLMWILKHLV
jgi:hypothetical protein